MMYGYGDGMFRGYSFIIPIIFMGIVIYALYKLLTPNHSVTHSSSAMDELNKKFVNGEISETEYLRKKQLINKK